MGDGQGRNKRALLPGAPPGSSAPSPEEGTQWFCLCVGMGGEGVPGALCPVPWGPLPVQPGFDKVQRAASRLGQARSGVKRRLRPLLAE